MMDAAKVIIIVTGACWPGQQQNFMVLRYGRIMLNKEKKLVFKAFYIQIPVGNVNPCHNLVTMKYTECHLI